MDSAKLNVELTGSCIVEYQELRSGAGRLRTNHRPALPLLCLLAPNLPGRSREAEYICDKSACWV